MTDDALHFNWAFEKIFYEGPFILLMWSQIMTLNQLLAICDLKALKKSLKKSSVLMMDTGLWDTFKSSLYISSLQGQ